MGKCKRAKHAAPKASLPSIRGEALPKRGVATLLAASLAFVPAGQALALQRADVVGIEAAGAESVAGVADLASAAGVQGASVLGEYLAGNEVSLEDFLTIDAQALQAIDKNVAQEIVDAQASLSAGEVDAAGSENASGNAAADATDASGEATSNSGESGEVSGSAEETNEADSDGVTGSSDGAGESDSVADGSADADSGDVGVSDSTGVSGDAGASGDLSGTVSSDAASNSADASGSAVSAGSSEAAGSTAASDDSASTEAAGSEAVYPQWTYSGDTTYTVTVRPSLTTQKFVAVIGEQAREIAQENDLYASVMIAQAILESGSGNSGLAQRANNLFGIKGSYEGASVTMSTAEDDGSGNLYRIQSRFRSYSSMQESLEDYADLLTDSLGSYYSSAWKANAETYADACEALEGRYATDTSYAEKLVAIIETYDLARYDEPLDYEEVDTYGVQATDPETGDLLYNEDGEPVMEERGLTDLVAELTSHLGEDYVWGGSEPGGFDCSGLVQYCYREAMGVYLPRTSYWQCLEGEDVDFADLHMGDLLFFADDDGQVSHVAVYLGEGCYIESPHTGDVVKVTSLSEKMPTFAKRVVEVQEVVDEAEEAEEQDSVEEETEPLGFFQQIALDSFTSKLLLVGSGLQGDPEHGSAEESSASAVSQGMSPLAAQMIADANANLSRGALPRVV